MAKYIILWGIQLYWLIPPSKRRKCLFKKSCSCHVYQETRTNGLFAGLKAMRDRVGQCRVGYVFYQTPDDIEWVILADKTVIKREKFRY